MYDILAKMDLLEGKNAKPDFLDLDKDGNREEPMKQAARQNEVTEQSVAEGFSDAQEIADQIANSIGGEKGLTSDDIYRAIDEFRSMMDDSDELDADEVAQILFDKLGIKDESIIKKAHNKVTEREFTNRDDFDRDAVPGDTVRTSQGGTLTKTDTGVRHERRPIDDVDDSDPVPGEKRPRGRPKGTGRRIGAKGPSPKSKLAYGESEQLRTSPAVSKTPQWGEAYVKAAEKILASILLKEVLPEVVQLKIEKALRLLGIVRDSMDVAVQDVSEKAVSKAQQRFMGMVHAAQKGEEPASAEVAQVADTMKKSDVEDFAKTKHKGLPEKKKKGVKETTVAGSVAPAPSNGKSKKGMIFGKGVYESQMAESYDKKLKSVLTEGLSLNMSIDHLGNKTLNVEATDEDAEKLAQILKLSGLGSSGGYETVPTSSCDSMEEDHSNKPEPQMQTAEYMTNTISGGLNKRKVTGMTTIPVVPTHQVSESEMENHLMKLYKQYKTS